MTQLSAKMYCMWLSAERVNFTAFRHKQIEYACKAGTTTAYSFGDDPKELSNHSWHLSNSRFKYQRVGSKSPNPFGLYDIRKCMGVGARPVYSTRYKSTEKCRRTHAPNTLYPQVVKGVMG